MHQSAPVAACDFVVFGGTGDLAFRKLLPALYLRDRDGQLTPDTRIISVSRAGLTDEDYRDKVHAEVRAFLPPGTFDADAWAAFRERLHHRELDVTNLDAYQVLTDILAGSDDKVRAFYLSCAPKLFGPVSRNLAEAGLITGASRVVLEKPIGTDLASARRINDEVGAVFAEHQIYRIDHYLGKETVQNLLVLRFANMLFEPLWRSGSIDHVQITVAEDLGVGGRGGYYDEAGALRDMVQNHLLQLLCLVAMEPPASVDADAVRDEKLKVLQALRHTAPGDVVRGQYRSGAVDGAAVAGYTEELGAPSTTETFVALRIGIDNWRWAGVPFYLRTGKRLDRRSSEIVVQFRPVPHSIFGADGPPLSPNRLVLRLQPDEGVRLHLMTKEPGPGGYRTHDASLNLQFSERFKTRTPDAYERLLMDIVRGNPTLFMRRDEVEAAWTWTEPILAAWAADAVGPKPYAAGSSGPAAAIALIERDGRTWHEEESS